MRKPLLLILLLVFCFTINSAAIAQPTVCEPLDDYMNSAGNLTTLGAGNIGPVNFLDQDEGILGNFRQVNYGPIMFSFPTAETVLEIQNGLLVLSNDITASSALQLVYDANNAGLNLDLSTSELLTFVLAVNDIPDTSFNLILRDSDGNEANSLIPSLPSLLGGDTLPADVDLPIANFSGIENVDLTDIQVIEIFVTPSEGGGTDMDILPIEICSPPTRDVPTLSEWGLIAMAGVLGIVGFMVMRRRKATA